MTEACTSGTSALRICVSRSLTALLVAPRSTATTETRRNSSVLFHYPKAVQQVLQLILSVHPEHLLYGYTNLLHASLLQLFMIVNVVTTAVLSS